MKQMAEQDGLQRSKSEDVIDVKIERDLYRSQSEKNVNTPHIAQLHRISSMSKTSENLLREITAGTPAPPRNVYDFKFAPWLLERNDFKEYKDLPLPQIRHRRTKVEKQLRLHNIDPRCKDRFFQSDPNAVPNARREAGRITNFWGKLERTDTIGRIRRIQTDVVEECDSTIRGTPAQGEEVDEEIMTQFMNDLKYAQGTKISSLKGPQFNYRRAVEKKKRLRKKSSRRKLSALQTRKFGTSHRQDRMIDYRDAEEKLQMVFVLRAKNLGIKHKSTFKAMDALLKVYQAQEKEGSAKHLINHPMEHISRIENLFQTTQSLQSIKLAKKFGKKFIRMNASSSSEQHNPFKQKSSLVKNVIKLEDLIKKSKHAKRAQRKYNSGKFEEAISHCVESIPQNNGDMDVYRIFIQSISRARQFPNWKDYCATVHLEATKNSFVIGEDVDIEFDYQNLSHLVNADETKNEAETKANGPRLHHVLDWVGIMTDAEFKSGKYENFVVRATVPNNNSGLVKFVGGLTEKGRYWAVYFVGESKIRPTVMENKDDPCAGATSFDVYNVECTLDVKPVHYCGDPIEVSYKLKYPEGIFHHRGDYIALYELEPTCTPYGQDACIMKRQLTVGENEGSLLVEGFPGYPGRYEFRMYCGAKQKELTGRSKSFEVHKKIPILNEIEKAMKRSLRIYLSFPTGETSDEREEFISTVFPVLRRICSEKRVSLSFTDFHASTKHKDLTPCEFLPQVFKEIDECRPLFVSVLTSRYGWIPRDIPVNVLSNHPWMMHHQNTGVPAKCPNNFSVQELEMLYSQLLPRLEDRLLDEEKVDDNHTKYGFIQARHISYVPINKSTKFSLLDLDPLSSERACMSLKRTVTTVCGKLPLYVKLSDFSETIFTELLRKIDTLYPDEAVPSELDCQAIACDSVVDDHCKRYVTNKGISLCQKFFLTYLTSSNAFVHVDHPNLLCSSEHTPLIILGKRGGGKTAFLCHCVKEYVHSVSHLMMMHNDNDYGFNVPLFTSTLLKPTKDGDRPTLIVASFIRSVRAFQSLSDVLRRINNILHRCCDTSISLTEADLHENFPSMIRKALKKLNLVVIIDGLDHSIAGEDDIKLLMHCFPLPLEENLKLVLTMSDSSSLYGRFHDKEKNQYRVAINVVELFSINSMLCKKLLTKLGPESALEPNVLRILSQKGELQNFSFLSLLCQHWKIPGTAPNLSDTTFVKKTLGQREYFKNLNYTSMSLAIAYIRYLQKTHPKFAKDALAFCLFVGNFDEFDLRSLLKFSHNEKTKALDRISHLEWNRFLTDILNVVCVEHAGMINVIDAIWYRAIRQFFKFNKSQTFEYLERASMYFAKDRECIRHVEMNAWCVTEIIRIKLRSKSVRLRDLPTSTKKLRTLFFRSFDLFLEKYSTSDKRYTLFQMISYMDMDPVEFMSKMLFMFEVRNGYEVKADDKTNASKLDSYIESCKYAVKKYHHTDPKSISIKSSTFRAQAPWYLLNIGCLFRDLGFAREAQNLFETAILICYSCKGEIHDIENIDIPLERRHAQVTARCLVEYTSFVAFGYKGSQPHLNMKIYKRYLRADTVSVRRKLNTKVLLDKLGLARKHLRLAAALGLHHIDVKALQKAWKP